VVAEIPDEVSEVAALGQHPLTIELLKRVLVAAHDDWLQRKPFGLLEHRVIRANLHLIAIHGYLRIGGDMTSAPRSVVVDFHDRLKVGHGSIAPFGQHRSGLAIHEAGVGQESVQGGVVGGVHGFGDGVDGGGSCGCLVHDRAPYPLDMSGASAETSLRPKFRLVRWLYQFVVDLIAAWRRDRVGGLSGEIAFFGLLGFFPMVIALAALLGSADAVIGADSAAEIESWLVRNVTEVFGSDNSLRTTVGDLFASTNGGALTAGAVLTVYAASRGFVSVVSALDIAYDHEHRRGWLATRVAGFVLTLFTLLVAAAVLILIVVGPLLGEGPDLARRWGFAEWFTVLWTWFRWPVVVALLVAWATSLYHFAPNRWSPWRHDLPGALLASAWWAVVSAGFSRYLASTSNGDNAIFGLLGGALSLVVWMYLMAMGLLLGAEVNATLAARRHAASANPDQQTPAEVSEDNAD